jgi:hypothetical protein
VIATGAAGAAGWSCAATGAAAIVVVASAVIASSIVPRIILSPGSLGRF